MLAVLLWDLAGRMFDVRQGKRLFGLISAGEQLATVLGRVSTPILVAFLGTVVIVRHYGERFGMAAAIEQENVEDSDRVLDLFRSRYVASIFLLSLLMMTVYHLVDFMFYEQARLRYSDQNALTNFFGLYQGVSQPATFLVITVVTGRFISRFGIKVGMRVRPLAMLVCGIVLTVAWTRDSGLAATFILVTMTKFLDHVILRSFSGPSFLVLYQPLPARRKLAVQLFNNTSVGPIAGGLVGCLLLLLAHLHAIELGILSNLMVVIIGAWIFTGKKVYGEYRESLSEALVRRVLDGGSSIYDDSMIEILKSRLESPHPGEVIYALDLLDKVEDESSADHYVDLLEHPIAEVRKEVLNRIGRERLEHLIDDVREVVAVDDDDEVLAYALRALCAIGESDVLDEVLPYMEHPDPIVRRGVISGMLRYGGIDGVLLAGQHLVELEKSEEAADRVFRRRCWATWPSPHFIGR
jgi:AAA family ATP:ADP antiporter